MPTIINVKKCKGYKRENLLYKNDDKPTDRSQMACT